MSSSGNLTEGLEDGEGRGVDFANNDGLSHVNICCGRDMER